MTAPEILFFDAAGTLIHLAESPGTVYARHFARFGLKTSPAEADAAFRAVWASHPFPDRPGQPDESADFAWWRALVHRVLARLSLENARAFPMDECFPALFAHYGRPDAWRLYPEVEEVLTALHGRIRLGVLSNFDRRLLTVLDGLGVLAFLSPVVLSSETGCRKPHPAIFQHAAAVAGTTPDACLLAGDDPIADWQGAAAAGFQVFPLNRPETSLRTLLFLAAAPPYPEKRHKSANNPRKG